MTARHPTPIPPFPATINRGYFGAWLSGFTDGEGTFTLGYDTAHTQTPIPGGRFAIRLRADDAKAVRMIQAFFQCGHLNWAYTKNAPENHHPQFSFCVRSAKDLFKKIAPHFRTCPLIAKKGNDFVIWDKAVTLLYSVTQRKRRRVVRGFSTKWAPDELAEFLALRAALAAQRVYNAAAVELPASRPPRPEPPSLFDRLP